MHRSSNLVENFSKSRESYEHVTATFSTDKDNFLERKHTQNGSKKKQESSNVPNKNLDQSMTPKKP